MIDDLQISHLSTEYVKVPVSVTANGVAGYNPTNDVVMLAFTAVGSTPGDSDWKTSDWETITGKYYARALVGPGTHSVQQLTVGQWWVWAKISDNPEVPVMLCGQIEVI